jgi:hypothetical protein
VPPALQGAASTTSAIAGQGSRRADDVTAADLWTWLALALPCVV